MKSISSRFMKLISKGSSELKFYPFFIIAFYLVAIISFGDSYIEDGLYIAKAESIIQDSDYNVVNQVEESFRWMLTPKYFHPTQHTEVQTPLIATLRVFERFLFGESFLEGYLLASITLSFFCLYYGFLYTSQALQSVGEKLDYRAVAIFYCSTVLSFYSIGYLTVTELFTFPVSAYVLKTVLKEREEFSFREIFFLALCSSVLLISKTIFIFPFLMCVYIVFSKKRNFRKRISFLIVTILVISTHLVNVYDQFGDYITVGSAGTILLDFSIINFLKTFIQGGFFKGGLFFSNPSFLFALLFSYFFFKVLFYKKIDRVIILLSVIWLVASFCQTVFFVGYDVSEQFPGRLILNSLPLLLIGFHYFFKIIKFRSLKIAVSIFFISLYSFSLINYLAINKGGHYRYVNQKFVENFNEFYGLFDVLLFNTKIINFNFVVALIWSTLVFLIFKLFKNKLFHFAQLWTGLLLIVFCLVSFSSSERNTQRFLKDNPHTLSNTVIGKSGEAYFFNYINETFEFRMRGASSRHMKEDIIKRRMEYYDIVKANLKKSTPEFDKILDNYIFNYGYFKDSP